MAKAKPGEIRTRLEKLYDCLASLGLDGAVLDRRDDIFYFSGYTGSDSIALLSAKKRKGWLITDSRYTEEAENTAPGLETTLWRGGFGSFIGGRLRALKMKEIAYTPATMTVSFFNEMNGEAGGKIKWQDIGREIGNFRAVKSKAEVAAMQVALTCAEQAFLAAKKRWKIGMTEVEVKNDLEWEMRKRGAQDTAFETIVAVGANASLPHAHAGNRKLTGGKMLLIDFGAQVNRYNSDLTRTMWLGEIPKVWQKRYCAVLAAQQAGIDAIRAGVPGSVPDRAARDVFAKQKLEQYFTHSLGHGVGLAVHEEPRLARISTRPLEAGNIVTVEPGVYFPGSGGIRVEEMTLVEKSGVRVLSTLPKQLEDAVL